MAINVRSDRNGDIRTNESDLLHNGVPLNIVKRSGLKLGHHRYESVLPFDPTSSPVEIVCIGDRSLRIGNLFCVMATPGYI